MKRFLLIIAIVSFSFYMFGCAKKETAEESLESMSMEALSSMGTSQVPAAIKPAETKVPASVVTPTVAPAATPVQAAKLEPLPPAGPYKPTAIEIQTALKNAGYYTGAIDGKAGPMTKKAALEFQKAVGLEADGKVGPKTWAELSKYLNPPAAATTSTQKR
jgi:peptidoglycan hydrolase-like protein with peptidoglycan-binding domain